MPTTIKRVRYTSATRSRPYPDQKWGAWSYSYTDEEVHKKITPSTIYRPRPSDLFANATSRQVTTVRTFDNTQSISSARNDTYQSFGGAFQNSYYLGTAPSPLVSIDRNAMYNSIRKKIRRDSVNIAMLLAEYPQTAELFRDAARIIATRGRSVARQFRKTGSKAASKRYLQFQYGISPLASDMVQLLQNLYSAASKPIFIQGVEKRSAFGFRASFLSPSSSLTTQPARAEVTRKLEYRTRYRAKLSASYLKSTLASCGFANPFSLAYELIPFSFVVDWWLNIGDMLASLDNLLIFDSVEIIDSSREETIEFISSSGVISGSCGRTTRVDTRSAPTTLSLISTPAIKRGTSSTHILNGLALLHVAKR